MLLFLAAIVAPCLVVGVLILRLTGQELDGGARAPGPRYYATVDRERPLDTVQAELEMDDGSRLELDGAAQEHAAERQVHPSVLGEMARA